MYPCGIARKIPIAGLGWIGRRHFRNLVALGERDIVLLCTHKATGWQLAEIIHSPPTRQFSRKLQVKC